MSLPEPITIEDLLNLNVVGDAEVDPTGTTVSYVVADNVSDYQEPNPRSSIWTVDVAAGDPHRLTEGESSDDLPRWSPDGRQLVFRSDRSRRGTGQLFLWPGGHSEPEPLHQFPSGVVDYTWAPDGHSLFVLTQDERRQGIEGDDKILFEEDMPFTRVWRLDLERGDAEPLSEGTVNVWEISPAPDGRSLAAIVSDLPYNWSWYSSRLVRIDLDSGEMTTLYAPERQLTGPCWLPDGSGVAVISSTWSDPGMTGGDVVLVPADGGAPRNLTEGHPRSYLSIHPCSDSSKLLLAANERGNACIVTLSLDGSADVLWKQAQAFVNYGMSASADGAVVAAALSSIAAPPDIWVGYLDSAPAGHGERNLVQRSRHNASLEERISGHAQSLTWQASDGLEIQGLLLRPTGSPDGAALPMVTYIHGGPTGSWDFAFYGLRAMGWIPLLLGSGVAVFLPNPRGSSGRGVAFAEANIGDMGGADLNDILSGVDACVERGYADPDRLGVCGWSYGGYLTPWALTRTKRFKVAVSGASITNWFSFHGGTDIPGFDETFYRADPYSLDGPYATRSPLFYVDHIETPTLFFHGEQDPCCPVGQAYEMYRALRSRGVETQCVIYPREGHGIREREHRRDLLQRGVAWLVERLSHPS